MTALSGGTVGARLAGTLRQPDAQRGGTYSYVVNNANSTVNALRTAARHLTETFTYTMRDTAGATSTHEPGDHDPGQQRRPDRRGRHRHGHRGRHGGRHATPRGNVLSNDTDVDTGDTKTVSALAGGTVGAAWPATTGRLTLNADGTYSYAINNANAAVNALRTAPTP